LILIVDLESAKEHLRITDNLRDADVLRKAFQASGIVVEFLKISLDSPETWPPAALSGSVVQLAEAMTYLALGELNENRESNVINVLSDAFVRLGSLYRLPTLA
jgi:hypothetical protein